MRPARRLAGALLATIFASGNCNAQGIPNPLQGGSDAPCVLDKCLNAGAEKATPAPPAPADTTSQPSFQSGYRRAASAPGNFDFYVLALSWSPGFCATGGAARAPDQCAAGSGLGFVVHGLWPQNQHGYPSGCQNGASNPSRMALDTVRGLYPDEGLARHEWRMHGTCSGKSPTDYFADVRRARKSITVPEAFLDARAPQTLAPLDIARAFVASNPRLRTDSMAVTCRQNQLEEVRICLTKDLRGFVPCPEVARASCRYSIEVPPAL